MVKIRIPFIPRDYLTIGKLRYNKPFPIIIGTIVYLTLIKNREEDIGSQYCVNMHYILKSLGYFQLMNYLTKDLSHIYPNLKYHSIFR
jgi:hypothetical protein